MAPTGKSEAKIWQQMLDKPLQDLTFIAFDSESTGRHPIVSQLLELAGVKFNSKGEILEEKGSLINPGRSIPEHVSRIHGINDSMVENAASVSTVVPDFLAWLQGKTGIQTASMLPPVLLAHNASFDVNFLQVAASRLGLPQSPFPVVDTLQLARKYFPEAKNHRLQTLIENMTEKDAPLTFHRAAADSRHVMRLFLAIQALCGNNCLLKDLLNEQTLCYFRDPFEDPETKPTAGNLKVKTIADAIGRSLDLFIHYNGTGGKFRQITPLSVIYSAKRYYLSAYCHLAGNQRIFRVNRISSIELVPRIEVRG